MTFAAPSISTVSQFGWDFANPVTAAYEYASFGLQARREYVDTNGIRGILDRIAESRAAGIIRVDGTIKVVPTKTLLSTILLKSVLGGTPTGTGTLTYPLANGLIDTYVTYDRIDKVPTYGKVWVDSATFSSEEGGDLEVDLDFVGQTETLGNSGTFPAGLVPPREPPFQHVGSTLTLGGTARQVKQMSVKISNNMTKDRFLNSQTLQTPAKVDRIIEINALVPMNADNSDLYTLATDSADTGSITWTDGTNTLTFTFGTIQLAGPAPWPVQGRGEIMLNVPLIARQVGSGPTAALSVTL